jgi:uncharacterized repeat protein (TIGR03803 family)
MTKLHTVDLPLLTLRPDRVQADNTGLLKAACLVFVFCAAAAITSRAQTVTTLGGFNTSDGNNPAGTLVQGFDGNLYGTASSGGFGTYCTNCGTFFKISPAGALTVLYRFCSQANCTDGYLPYSGLVEDINGNFYGTTAYGGNPNCTGCGTVFKVTPTGTLTTLHLFCLNSNCPDGYSPSAGLVQAVDGNFYGTTFYGGQGQFYCSGGLLSCGTLFKMTPSGKLTTLYSFCKSGNCPDGLQPNGYLIQGTNGSLYGTTNGNSSLVINSGTVFKISTAGKLTTLHRFQGPDGAEPVAGVVEGSDGNFYGTTFGGGAYNSGAVFKMTPGGTLTTLYSFCSQYPDCTDGLWPNSTLVQGTDGNFYGTTYAAGGIDCATSGTGGCGTLFQITPAGQLTTLYRFCANCIAGFEPAAGLVQATNGTFYGTTNLGGNHLCSWGCGEVFSLSMSLGPFVQTVPGAGRIGSKVAILGNHLTGATGATFNAMPASITVVSDTLITTAVPAGATTGSVQVTTPSGTLTSNRAFQVK